MKISTIPMEDLAQILNFQLESGGTARLVVTGDSMYPTFRHRKDVVILQPVSRELKKGDVILYQRKSGQYVLHRIVTKPKNGEFICCGDNQWEKEPMEASQVVALVSSFVRKGKTIDNKKIGYRMWVAVLVGLFFLRRPLLWMRRTLGKIRRVFL